MRTATDIKVSVEGDDLLLDLINEDGIIEVIVFNGPGPTYLHHHVKQLNRQQLPIGVGHARSSDDIEVNLLPSVTLLFRDVSVSLGSNRLNHLESELRAAVDQLTTATAAS